MYCIFQNNLTIDDHLFHAMRVPPQMATAVELKDEFLGEDVFGNAEPDLSPKVRHHQVLKTVTNTSLLALSRSLKEATVLQVHLTESCDHQQ